ncbi:Uncharacterised protein [Klebsiella pneumoniae]|nr:Uncharacterised protein [Klebsiella pneumoniae]
MWTSTNTGLTGNTDQAFSKFCLFFNFLRLLSFSFS